MTEGLREIVVDMLSEACTHCGKDTTGDPSRVETLNANGKTSNDVTLNKWAHECLGYRVNAYVAVVHVATGKTLDALRP